MTGYPSRIGVNAIFLEPGMGGLESYVREVVPRMARQAPDSRVTVVCNSYGRELLAGEGWGSQVEISCPTGFGRRGFRAISELTALGPYASSRFDALLNVAMTAPLRTRAANVVLVADVTWLKFDDLQDGGSAARIWRLVVPPVARHADRLIVLSEDGRREISEMLAVPASKIDVIGLGFDEADPVAPTPEAELRARLGLGEGPVVLNLAAKKAHKNLVRLVEAHAIVVERVPGAQLVLPGAPTPYEDRLRERARQLGIEQSVHFPGFVSDADREGLYALAGCLAFPSLNEGFGLPILEAMARDVPVVTSSVSAMPEVAGEAAVLVDPESVEAIAAGIASVLLDQELAAALVAAGRRRLELFRWDGVAQQTLETLARAVAGRGERS